jgi:FkbM family methyltransferase
MNISVTNYYSQFGEDRILADLFSNCRDGLCVEVGANDGVHGSTSLHFEESGWRCILVEPNPHLCQLLRARRNASVFEFAASDREDVATLHIVEGAEHADGLSTISDDPSNHARIRMHGFESQPMQVRTRTLDRILEDAGIDNKQIDFVSIDVEGHELAVLRGLSLERWRPGILLVEDNSDFRDRLIPRYLRNKGYVRFLRTGVNDWYARQDDRRFVTVGKRLRFTTLVAKRRAKQWLKSVPGIMQLRKLSRSRQE